MKKIIIVFTIIAIPNLVFAATESKCEGLNKLKLDCNIIGSGMKKLRNFSEKNQTLDQSLKNVKDSETLKNVKDKIKKK